MSTITVVTVDAGGNVPPALRIAGELARRGHRVDVLGHARQADAVTSAGLGFRSLASLDYWDPSVRRSAPSAIERITRLAADPGIEREVGRAVAAAGSDVALVDCLMPSSLRGAHAGGARTAALFHTFLAFWMRGFERGPVGIVARLRGADPVRAWARADARLVACDATLDPASSLTSGLPAASEWIGAVETGVPSAPDAERRPLVLVSLSTTWFPGQAETYQRIIDALGSLPVRGLVTLGGLHPERELRVPANVDLRDAVPHAEVLPRAAAVIGHGGHSTTMRALAHSVPVLVMPMHPLLDQPMVGAAVERAGAGIVLPRTAPSARIASAVTSLLADEGIRAGASAVGGRLRSTDAASAAADSIERLLGERGDRAA